MGVSRGMKEAQTGDDEEAWKSGNHGFVVGIDPVGSILSTNGVGEISGYQVEGIVRNFFSLIPFAWETLGTVSNYSKTNAVRVHPFCNFFLASSGRGTTSFQKYSCRRPRRSTTG